MTRRWVRLLVSLWLAAAVLLAGCGPGAEPETPPAEDAAETITPTPALTATPTRNPVPVALGEETPVPDIPAESALVRIRDTGEVRVGVLYNDPPLGYLADNGTVMGYEAALVRKIAERWDVEVVFVQVTRQTRLPMLYSDEVDFLAAGMTHRRDLEPHLEFSQTIFRGGIAVAVREGTEAELGAVGGLGPVAAVGEDAQAAVRAALGVEPVPHAHLEDAVAALVSEEVAAVAASRLDLMLPAQSNDAVALLEGVLAEEPVAFAVRRGDIPMRDLLDLTFQQIVAEGELGELFSQNFYALPADVFTALPGEAAYDFGSMPDEMGGDGAVLARIRRGEALRVAGLALEDEPQPFDAQPILDGYNRALVNELARRWNVPIEEIPDSAGQGGVERLQAGEADLTVGVRAELGLIGQVALSQPTHTRALRLIHLDDVRVANVLDLETKPTGAVEPVALSRDLVEDNNTAPRVSDYESLEEAYDALQDRSLYAIVGDEYALALMAAEDEAIVMDESAYRPREYGIAVPRRDTEFLTLVNVTLQDMLLDGTLDRLQEEYLLPYLPEGGELEPLALEIWPGEGDPLGAF